jgi:hypothetical protein
VTGFEDLHRLESEQFDQALSAETRSANGESITPESPENHVPQGRRTRCTELSRARANTRARRDP